MCVSMDICINVLVALESSFCLSSGYMYSLPSHINYITIVVSGGCHIALSMYTTHALSTFVLSFWVCLFSFLVDTFICSFHAKVCGMAVACVVNQRHRHTAHVLVVRGLVCGRAPHDVLPRHGSRCCRCKLSTCTQRHGYYGNCTQ